MQNELVNPDFTFYFISCTDHKTAGTARCPSLSDGLIVSRPFTSSNCYPLRQDSMLPHNQVLKNCCFLFSLLPLQYRSASLNYKDHQFAFSSVTIAVLGCKSLAPSANICSSLLVINIFLSCSNTGPPPIAVSIFHLSSYRLYSDPGMPDHYFFLWQ